MKEVSPGKDHREREKEFPEEVETRARRRMKAQEEKNRSIWFGFGMFGLVGWSVAIPTLAGIALGLWLDTVYPKKISWTLTCLFAGVVLGCVNAWYWVNRESRRRD